MDDLFWDFDQAHAAARQKLLDEARPLQPQIIRLVNVIDDSRSVLKLLGSLGPEAAAEIPALQRFVLANSPSLEESRWCGLWAMLQILPEDQPIGPFFLRYLEVISPRVEPLWAEIGDLHGGKESEVFFMRDSVCRMIAGTVALPMMVAGHTTVELPFIVQATSPTYPTYIRAVAIGVLAMFEREATAATPALRPLLNDSEPAVRYTTAAALVRIEQRPAQIPELSAGLRLSEEHQATFEADAKAFLDTQAEELVRRRNSSPDWVSVLLKDHRGTQRRYALRVLQDAGLLAYAAVPAIVELLQDPNAETRAAAIEALWAIDPETATWELRTR